MIIYFTGTGNSHFVAERIANSIGDAVVSLNDRIKTGRNEIDASEKYIFSVPTNAWRIPHVVENWIERTDFPCNVPVWFMMTCGSEIGAAEKYLVPLCERKGLTFMGVKEIVMPENYIAMFNAPEDDEAKQIVKDALPAIDEAADSIQKGLRFEGKRISLIDRLKSGKVNELFYKYSVKDLPFKVDNKCISCGKCESLCPVNNIEITAGKPVWNGNCIHCMACICHCPTSAIEYGRKSRNQPRYTCPEIDDII